MTDVRRFIHAVDLNRAAAATQLDQGTQWCHRVDPAFTPAAGGRTGGARRWGRFGFCSWLVGGDDKPQVVPLVG
jgi:hypothetical protein